MPSTPFDRRLYELELIPRLHALPDAAALTTDEAACFLRTSLSSMERMRRHGTGPAYVQGGDVGARGTNQKCVYLKSDLLAWQNKHKVTGSMAAAQRRGQAFLDVESSDLTLLRELGSTQAFYVNRSGELAGLVSEVRLARFIERLGTWKIVWIKVIDALESPWEHDEGREFCHLVGNALHRQQTRVNKALACLRGDSKKRNAKID